MEYNDPQETEAIEAGLQPAADPEIHAQQEADPALVNEDVLSVDGIQRAFNFLERKAQKNKSVYIGRIINKSLRQKSLSEDDYDNLVDLFEYFKDRGILEEKHSKYKLVGEKPTEDDIYEAMGSLALRETPPTTQHEADSSSAESIELSDLEQSILNIFLTNALKGEDDTGLRMQDIRDVVPVIKELDKEQYEEFKKNFSTIRGRVESYLTGLGISASWEITGKARGKRYKLKETKQ